LRQAIDLLEGRRCHAHNADLQTVFQSNYYAGRYTLDVTPRSRMSAASDFLKADFAATLFPLKTNLLIAEMHEKEVSEYIYQKILDDKQVAENFLSQQRVHATKPRGHLRRTVKLDPIPHRAP